MPKPLMCDAATLQKDLTGNQYVVTGANSGIGLVTARQLLKQGANVVLACRRVTEGEAQLSAIPANERPGTAEVRALDLADLSSVRAFAASFTADHAALHGLVNNAGVMNTPEKRTADGFEMQIGVNHLGHFLLTELLLDTLKKSAPSRIINVSSCFHDKAMGREGRIDVDDLHFQSRKYDGWEAYAQSKLANLLHAQSLAQRLEGTDVFAASVHPGWVRTNLSRHTMPLFVQNYIMRPVMGLIGMIEPWQGAQSTLHALLSDDALAHPGAYFSQLGMYRDKGCNKGGWPLRSPNPAAHEGATAEQLWEYSSAAVQSAPVAG